MSPINGSAIISENSLSAPVRYFVRPFFFFWVFFSTPGRERVESARERRRVSRRERRRVSARGRRRVSRRERKDRTKRAREIV
jgi:hypothetical protein